MFIKGGHKRDPHTHTHAATPTHKHTPSTCKGIVKGAQEGTLDYMYRERDKAQ